MCYEKEIKQYIREHWFSNHVATLKKHGDITVLEWTKPGTIVYSVRYVFDGCNMYITGDIGQALFCLAWKATVDSFAGISTSYFMEKMKAFSDDRYDFDANEVEKELTDWKNQFDFEYDNEIGGNERDELDELVNYLITEVNHCNNEAMWANVVNNYSDRIQEYDPDYWEWMYIIGRKVPARIYGYIVGLQMAAEQLKERGEI